ncbi:DEAD/DEAH box helicase [Actinomadura atramentaria]|uniref:DEAD/DEAH box helicase n=1 Tax=Actinomadura atramentaria TaxID=1990 RepID=UPI0003609362|nr:DEAD/DEAH box helicase [Actinomadura atramentaria]
MTRDPRSTRRSTARGRGGRPRSGGTGPRRPDTEFTAPTGTTPGLPPAASFAELPLPKALLTVLAEQGVTEPFPIQSSTLPDALAGRDVLARGRTGSGKTLAFGLAVLARTAGRRAEPRRPLALVLVPTRELAQQVTDSLAPYAAGVRLRLATAVGGLSLTKQAAALRRGAEVLVATPGRLADLVDRGDCDLRGVEIAVLDEADQMTDMGFLPQVTRLLDQVAPGGQRMLFSATLDRNIDKLVRRFLSDPVSHSVDPSAGAVVTMDHHLLLVDEADKQDTLAHIAARDGQVIMFVGMKHAADRLVRRFAARGVQAVALHGGKSQSQRNRALDGFKSGTVPVLVATNVAARGIHIDDLDLVVNVDPPADHKDYLHRGGRTARAGRTGTVVTLVLPEQRRETTRLMETAGIAPSVTAVVPGGDDLARITGARVPSGTPVAAVAAPAAAPARERRAAAPRGGADRSTDLNTGRSTDRNTGRGASRSTGRSRGTRGGAGRARSARRGASPLNS